MKSLITCLAFVTTAASAQLRMVEMRSCPSENDARTCSVKCEMTGKALVGLTDKDKTVAAVVPHKNNIPQEIQKVYRCDVLDWRTFVCGTEFEKLTCSEMGGVWIKSIPTPERCAELSKVGGVLNFNWECYEPLDANGVPVKSKPSFQCFTELKNQ